MAKGITSDQLETLLTTVLSKTIPEIMNKVLSKFEECFDKLMEKFDTKLDKYHDDLQATTARLNKIEQCCAEILARPVTASPGLVATVNKSDPALQVLMAIETEKTERVKRQRNVMISGLPEVQGTTDVDVFLQFCENHLTVKPKPIHCHRIGRMTGDNPRKLKVTLESESAVDDLISSSHLLRTPDSTQCLVYFNHDLTPLEAQAAYEIRQMRKSNVHTSGVMAST